MKKLVNQNAFNFTTDKAFAQVIGNCKTIRRKGQAGTWITLEELLRPYKTSIYLDQVMSSMTTPGLIIIIKLAIEELLL